MKTIKIITDKVTATAELNESETAKAIWDALPLKCNANRWGDEIYFAIPVKMKEDASAKADVEVGDLAYWAPGNAFCIFWGPTPASHNEQPRAASPVNLIGRIVGDATKFRSVKSGSQILVERV